MTARVFWPPAEAAQADYEMLRACVLGAGRLPAGLAAAARPPWTPHADPREQALAASYQFLLGAAGLLAPPSARVREERS